MSEQKLLVRMPNWVGDTLMALPALALLYQQGWQLTLLGKPWMADLLAALPYRCVAIAAQKSSAIKQLRSLAERHLLLFPNSFSSALVGKLAGKILTGYRTDGRRFLIRHAFHKQLSVHEVEHFYYLAEQFLHSQNAHFKAQPLPDALNLPINDEQYTAADKALKAAKVSEPYVVLCPGAIGLGENKQSKAWPYWSEFAVLVSKQQCVIACPGPNEVELFQQRLPGVTLLPNLSLGEYAAVLKKAQQVIANDSGPMHLAASVDAKVLGIFGVSNPERVRPWGGEFIGERHQWPSVEAVIEKCQPKFLGLSVQSRIL